MKLLPHYTFSLQAHDPLSVVLERLAAQVEPPKTVRWFLSQDHLLYEGSVSEEGFKISRIIHYRNSMLPVIRGRFEQSSDGTVVQINMTLHPLVLGFLGFFYLTWYSIVAPIALMSGWNGVTLLFIGLPLVILVVFAGAFWFEAQHSRRELTQILLGQRDPQQAQPNRLRKTGFQIFRIIVFLLGIAFAFYTFSNLSKSSKTSTIRSAKVSTSGLQILESGSNPCALKQAPSNDCNFSVVHTIKGHPSAAVMAISADGKTLVSGGSDKALKVWDLTTGKLRQTLQSPSGEVRSVALSPNGKLAVSGGGDRMTRIWDLATGQQKAMLKGNPDDIVGNITAVAIQTDGKTLVSTSWDGTVKIWDLATAQLKATYNTAPASVTTFFGPFSFSSGGGGRVLALSAEGKTALISDGHAVSVWDLMTGKLQTRLQEEGFQFLPGSVLSGSISPDGKIAAIQYRITSHDGQIKLWDTVTGKVIANQSYTATSINTIPIILDNQRIIGQSNGTLQVWNLATQKLDASFQTGSVSAIALSPDSKTLAGIATDKNTGDAQIKVWRR
jgi:WD40 repeat protein